MENNQEMLVLKKSWIMSVFLIVPLVAFFGFWDWNYNDQALLPVLGIDTLYLPLYLLIFGLPHILASLFSFFDKEYFSHYKKHLIIFFPILFLLLQFIISFNYNLAVSLFLIATVYHVIRQQTGISLMYGVPKNNWFIWWNWSLIIAVSIMYLTTVQVGALDSVIKSAQYLFNVTFALAGLVSYLLIQKTKELQGKIFVFLTYLMVVTSFTLTNFGYVFLAILVIRFLHDVPAFMFYISHEVNRNKFKINNLIYKAVPLVPMSLIIFVPAFAVFMGVFFRETVTDPKIYFSILATVSVFHYYIESIIWKRNSLHRKYVSVK